MGMASILPIRAGKHRFLRPLCADGPQRALVNRCSDAGIPDPIGPIVLLEHFTLP